MCKIFKKGIASVISGFVLINSCKNPVTVSEKAIHSRIPVEVSSVRIGPMSTFTELNATSVFLSKAAIKAPSTGFIDNIMVNQGEEVADNQLLFKIRTKEATALMGDSSDNIRFSGVLEVKASTAGIISSLDHSGGDYVAEGDQLCQIAIQNSLVFILDVPYELSGTVKQNNTCQIVLPDSQVIKGIIRSRLPSMVGNSQTERFIVRLAEPKSLPENLSGKIRLINESVKEAVSLPKSSILTDETMHDFWVMKLINDSVAVKIPVSTGIATESYIQIKKPVFKASDLFLTSGNYGLGDTVYVKVLETTGNEQ
jgi:hypothetical protein